MTSSIYAHWTYSINLHIFQNFLLLYYHFTRSWNRYFQVCQWPLDLWRHKVILECFYLFFAFGCWCWVNVDWKWVMKILIDFVWRVNFTGCLKSVVFFSFYFQGVDLIWFRSSCAAFVCVCVCEYLNADVCVYICVYVCV